MVHLDVEDQVEELLRQISYAIKNQLLAKGIGGFHARKGPIVGALMPAIKGFGCVLSKSVLKCSDLTTDNL